MQQKEQCEMLLAELLPFGEEQIKKHGEFYPYGAVLNTDLQIVKTATYDGDDNPPSDRVISFLQDVHKKLATEGKIVASAIVTNATVRTPMGKRTDAIVMYLEHKDGYCAVVVAPYKKGLFKKVSFAPLYAMQGDKTIF